MFHSNPHGSSPILPNPNGDASTFTLLDPGKPAAGRDAIDTAGSLVLFNAGRLPTKLELESNQALTRDVRLSVDSHSNCSALSNQHTVVPSAFDPSATPDPPATLYGLPPPSIHHDQCLLAQISFDPVVRIIRPAHHEDSSDDDLPALITSRRLRNISSKGPVRLCTKKISLPLNISTSSLIGAHHNHSTSSLPPPLPTGPQSARLLIERTRQEIEEDEQFIPDAPRHLNLILPLLTRQPSRRTVRQQEQRRLERWRELFGGGKSSIKSSEYSNLYFLSADLRNLLQGASLPVQLSTNTAINSIHSAISPSDLLIRQPKNDHPPEPNLPGLPTASHLESSPSHPSISPSIPLDGNVHDPQPARIRDLAIDGISYSKPETKLLPQKNARKTSRFGWLGAKLKAKRLNEQQPNKEIFMPNALPDPPLEKPLTRQTPIEGVPLKRMSTPCAPVDEPFNSGVPLQRLSTPATAMRKQSTFGAPFQRNTPPVAHLERQTTQGDLSKLQPTSGAVLERQKTPGTPLQGSSDPFNTSSTNKSNDSSFLRKLIHWPTKSSSRNRGSSNNTSDHINQLDGNVNEHFGNSQCPSMANISKTSLLLGNCQTGSSAKWGNRREISLRQCCEACSDIAEVGKDPNHEIAFSDRARSQYYSQSWLLEDVIKQDGIPAQHVKLLSKELGAPYDAWVAQIIEPCS